MGFVSAKPHNSQSRLHSRERKPNSRLGIQPPSVLEQLEIRPVYFSNTYVQNNVLQYGPICKWNKSPTPKLHQLATRSRNKDIRCSFTPLVKDTCLCISSILPDFTVSEECQNGESHRNNNNTCMDSTIMVLDSTRDVNSGPNSPSNNTPNSEILSGEQPSHNSEQLVSVNRLAYLRRSFSTMELSENVNKLLIGSW